MAFRSDARKSADEFCSVRHINGHYGIVGDTRIALFLGLDEKCSTWLTPDGRDVTELCDRSAMGGFSSGGPWTLQGWVLDIESMSMLRGEFPEHFRAQVVGRRATHDGN